MKRPVITAAILQEMLADTEGTIAIPKDAILTPSARDLAGARGITLARHCGQDQAPGSSGSLPEGLSGGLSDSEPRSGAGIGGQDPVPAPSSAERETERSFEAIRQAVLERLSPELRAAPQVDELIRATLRTAFRQMANPGQARNGSSVGLASLVKSDPVSGLAAWKRELNGLVVVDSERLPRKNPTEAVDTVQLVNVLSRADGATADVGYLEWCGAGFARVAEQDEVGVVLEGELCLTLQGTPLRAKPGDVVYVPRGSSLQFSSTGPVRFVYVVGPADREGA